MAARTNAEYESKIQQLEDEIERLRVLEDATFLQLRKNKMTDAAIMQKFENICDDIEQWINAVLADSLSHSGRFTKHRGQNRKGKMTMVETLSRKMSLPPEIADAENLEYLFLSKEIMGFLSEEIFQQQYPIGVWQYQDLRTVEKGMKRLGNEDSKISAWTRETLSALVLEPSFERERQKMTEKLLRKAEKMLHPWLPPTEPFTKHEPQFRRDLLESSIVLHQAMTTSPDAINFIKPRIRSSTAPFSREEYKNCKLIDLDTWQQVSPTGVTTMITVLFPGIERVTAEGQSITLVEPTLAVSRFSRTPKSPSRSGTDNSQTTYDKVERQREDGLTRVHSNSDTGDRRQRESNPSSTLAQVAEYFSGRSRVDQERQPSQGGQHLPSKSSRR